MGWKNVKEYYRIERTVQVTEKGICIGSPYIHDIIVIGMDGVIKKRYGINRSENTELKRYQIEIDRDPAKLKELVESEDTFDKSITVYTYEDGKILEKLCEEPGWPNITHDGCLMYENTFSTDKSKVVKWAKDNAQYGIENRGRLVSEAKGRLLECYGYLDKVKAELEQLNKDYPGKEA